MTAGIITLHSACGYQTADTEADRAAGKWEPGIGRWRPADPDQRVRFCNKGAGHTTTHERVALDHPEHWGGGYSY